MNAYTREGLTALQLAARTGSLPAMRALIEAAGDDVNDVINAIDLQRGGTALHVAVENDRQAVVDYLLKNVRWFAHLAVCTSVCATMIIQ